MLATLPAFVRRAADAAFAMFLANADHSALQRHPLQDHGRGRHRVGSISVSVTMQYQAIYVVDGDTNVWYWIGSHADYDTLTGRKS